MFRKGRTPLLPNAGPDQNVPLSRERRSGPKPEENIPMTLAEFYVLRPTLEALLDANIERFDRMSDDGKIAFQEACIRLALAGYADGRRDQALVDHVNTYLGG